MCGCTQTGDCPVGYACDANAKKCTTVCNGNQTSVLAVSHTYPAAVVKAHPGGPAGDARREVQQWPIGDCV